MKPSLLILFMSFVLSGCATGPDLSPEIQKIKLLKADPDPKCEEIGVISANSYFGCNQECQRKKIKKEAYEKGANYIRLDTYTAGNQQTPDETTTTAFKCPNYP